MRCLTEWLARLKNAGCVTHIRNFAESSGGHYSKLGYVSTSTPPVLRATALPGRVRGALCIRGFDGVKPPHHIKVIQGGGVSQGAGGATLESTAY
jgi:hypothetical protein